MFCEFHQKHQQRSWQWRRLRNYEVRTDGNRRLLLRRIEHVAVITG